MPSDRVSRDNGSVFSITASGDLVEGGGPFAPSQGNNGLFVISRAPETSPAVTVNFDISGSAVFERDYTLKNADEISGETLEATVPVDEDDPAGEVNLVPLGFEGSGSVTIPNGASSATLVITPVDDREVEASETVSISLQSGSNYTVGTPSSATLSIRDDDLTNRPNTSTIENFIEGSANNDTLRGTPDSDRINGNERNDVLVGDSGDDELNGQEGNDLLFGNGGNDFLDGGDGDDSLLAGRDDDVLIDSAGSNVLMGDLGNDTAQGGADEDLLFGNGGEDILDGGAGNDTIYGGQDRDILRGSGENDWLHGDRGNDAIEGGIGQDTLLGNSGNDLLDGGDDGDTLNGGEGRDTLLGNAGSDVLVGEAGDDRILGGNQDDSLFGNQGQDTLDGEGGNDTLFGGAGNDSITGGAGNDILAGNAGTADTLTGGPGEDLFALQPFGGRAILADFTDEEDRLQLTEGLTRDQLVLGLEGDLPVIYFTGSGQVLAELPTLNELDDIDDSDFVMG